MWVSVFGTNIAGGDKGASVGNVCIVIDCG